MYEVAARRELPFVSIVIATYGRRQQLVETLGKIRQDSYPHYEVIVVDQTEEEEGPQGEPSFPLPSTNEVRYFHLPIANLAAARNFGIEQSRGEIILFCDDDTIPFPAWVHAHARHYADPQIMAVAGGEIVSPDSAVDRSLHRAKWKRVLFRILAFWQDLKSWFTHSKARGRIGNRIVAQFTRTGALLHDWTVEGTTLVDFGKGCNMSFRRTVFSLVGLFDIRCTGREETDLFLRMKRKGMLVRYDSAAKVLHLKAGTGGTWHRLRNPETHYHWLFYYEGYFFLKNFSKAYFSFFLCRLAPDLFRCFTRLGFPTIRLFLRATREAYQATLRHGQTAA